MAKARNFVTREEARDDRSKDVREKLFFAPYEDTRTYEEGPKNATVSADQEFLCPSRRQ